MVSRVLRFRKATPVAVVAFLLAAAATNLSGPVYGVFQGGDASYPWSSSDAWGQLVSSLNPWATFSVASGYYSADNSSWLLPLFRYLALSANDNPALWQRSEIILLVMLAGLAMYGFVRHLTSMALPAIVCGLLYATSPVVFNFLVIGWNSLIVTYVAVPIVAMAIIRFKSNSRLTYLCIGICAGILFAGSAAFPAFIAVTSWSLLVRRTRDRLQLRTIFRIGCYLSAGFILPNLFWIIPRITYAPLSDANGLSSLAASTISSGARSFFWITTPLNGEFSQYNNSFFEGYPVSIRIFLYLLPVIATAVFLFPQVGDRRTEKLTAFFCVATYGVCVIDLSKHVGAISLVMGREPGRNYALLLFFMILLVGSTVKNILSHSSKAANRQIFTTFACLGVAGLLGLPFWLGRLEATSLPPQPALTLRPAPISREFEAVTEILKRVPNDPQSTLAIPGAPTVRLADAFSRFEPLFNTVATSATHFPWPATWWSSDKIGLELKNYIDRRGAVLTSGDVDQILGLMRAEGSSQVVFDLASVTPGDMRTLEAVATSKSFSEVIPKSRKKTDDPRFRIFVVRNREWDYGSPIASMSQGSFEPTVLTPHNWTNLYYLGSQKDPIGSETELCVDLSQRAQPVSLETVASYSRYLEIDVRFQPADSEVCKDSGSEWKTPKIEIGQLSTGRTAITIRGAELKGPTRLLVDIRFKPAILQQRLLVGTLVSILMCLVWTVASLALRSRRNRRLSTR